MGIKKAGIAIDSYKLRSFKRGLKRAGHDYGVGEGITPGTKMIYIKFEEVDFPKIERLIKKLNHDSKNSN